MMLLICNKFHCNLPRTVEVVSKVLLTDQLIRCMVTMVTPVYTGQNCERKNVIGKAFEGVVFILYITLLHFLRL